MLTTRQIQNRGLREMGLVPETYRFDVGRFDVVRLLRSEPEGEPERFVGHVERVEDHGWYRVVTLTRQDGRPDRVTLWENGPPDWGVVEVIVVKKLAAVVEPDKGRR